MWLSDVSAQEGFISGIKVNTGYLSWGICGNSNLGFRTASLQHVGALGSSGFIPAGQRSVHSFNKRVLRHLKTYIFWRHNDKRKVQACSQGVLTLM